MQAVCRPRGKARRQKQGRRDWLRLGRRRSNAPRPPYRGLRVRIAQSMPIESAVCIPILPQQQQPQRARLFFSLWPTTPLVAGDYTQESAVSIAPASRAERFLSQRRRPILINVSHMEDADRITVRRSLPFIAAAADSLRTQAPGARARLASSASDSVLAIEDAMAFERRDEKFWSADRRAGPNRPRSRRRGAAGVVSSASRHTCARLSAAARSLRP
jgi:hypothetical protein